MTSNNDFESSSNALLAALLFKPELKSIWYNNKEIKLDGYRFIACRFDKCTLIVTAANFELINCYIGEDTLIQFGHEVSKAIRLYNLRNERAYSEAPFFAPIRNSDGTITVNS